MFIISARMVGARSMNAEFETRILGISTRALASETRMLSAGEMFDGYS